MLLSLGTAASCDRDLLHGLEAFALWLAVATVVNLLADLDNNFGLTFIGLAETSALVTIEHSSSYSLSFAAKALSSRKSSSRVRYFTFFSRVLPALLRAE